MVTFRYPAWFSELDQEHIREAVVAADAALTGELRLSTPEIHVVQSSGYPNSEAEAIQFVLAIAAAVVLAVQRYQDHQPTNERRRVVDDLVDQVIVYAERMQLTHARTTLATFETHARDALSTQSWWQRFQATTKAPKVRTRKVRDVEHLKAERDRVVTPLLEQLDWSTSKWATESGVSPSVTLGFFKGVNTRRVYRTRLKNTLAKALNQPTFRLPE